MTEPSAGWVALSTGSAGWPWPDESWGLGPIYGDGGWCRGCGTPLVEQSGPLIIRKFPTADVWTPNWRHDVVCVSERVAVDISGRFNVELGEVHKPRTGPTGARQILPVQTGVQWYRQADLASPIRALHGEHHGDRMGASCGTCDRWRWLPISVGAAPIAASALAESSDVIVSPEVFGAGMKSFRHMLFRRPLAETLAAASPRSCRLVEVEIS